jgi:hypothetical protein
MLKSHPLTLILLLLLSSCKNAPTIGTPKLHFDVFSFDQRVTLPGTPDIIYDAISGDISGWWDHSFSKKPYRLFLEAKPGGGFYEIFDEKGNGAKHATVIYAERGKMLRFDGPLGLSGNAIQLVSTYRFEQIGQDSTRLTLSVHGSGEMAEGVPKVIEGVWNHFLIERFKPYVESGQHLAKKE